MERAKASLGVERVYTRKYSMVFFCFLPASEIETEEEEERKTNKIEKKIDRKKKKTERKGRAVS